MTKSDAFKILTKRRGDPEPAPNRLSLQRTLWLDFDGAGFTFHDAIDGEMHRGWRLGIPSQLQLGRVAVNGTDQFITTLDAGGEQGVEVRHGQIRVEADGRYTGPRGALPAVGWQEDFAQVENTLHLPPGWRLLAVPGADWAGGAWFERWSLLDIFLVLIAALAVQRLSGMAWGAVTLVALTLLWHESGAPHLVWLNLIAASALARAAPPGRLQRSATLYRYVSLLGLILIALPYAVDAVRIAIYPQLARPGVVVQPEYPASIELERKFRSVPAPSAPVLSEQTLSQDSAVSRSKSAAQSLYSDVVDPSARVQTGPGLPQWQWTTIPLRWDGPVQAMQPVGLTLMPPLAAALWLITGVVLMFLLGARLAGITVRQGTLRMDLGKWAVTGLMVFTATLLVQPHQVNADATPSDEVLKQLKQRLMQVPDCAPQCAQIARMKLSVDPRTLQILLDVHAQETVAVPVPARDTGWLPAHVLLDDQPATAIRRNGTLWVLIAKGTHRLVLRGELADVPTVDLPLILAPHAVEVAAQGWVVRGVRTDGSADQALQLERQSIEASAKPLGNSALPAFVQIHRSLHLGLNWRMETEVVRLSDPGTSVNLEIPLVEGESVVTDGIDIAQGKAVIQLAPNQRVRRWESNLDQRPQLTLHAPDADWTETWRLDASPLWHAEAKGIAAVQHTGEAGTWLPEWRPWPGETLSISIARPAGVQGNTLTVDSTQMSVSPGQRATDVALQLQLRSSQADQSTITLPSDIKLQAVQINGKTQPIRLEGAQVRLPIIPGTQSIEVRWQQAEGVATLLHTPSVNLGIPSVNASLNMTVPADRWLLFAAGPRLGPAVLFWGVLLVVLLAALALGRVKIVPLRTHQWLLLGIGLTQANPLVVVVVAGWFFALAWRQNHGVNMSKTAFNVAQFALALLTIAALSSFMAAVGFGLLGTPDMQIAGNGSYGNVLNWYADHADAALPGAWVLSVPLWVYRVLMLLWSLWLAFALLNWLKWGWNCYSHDGLWRSVKWELGKRAKPKAADASNTRGQRHHDKESSKGTDPWTE